MNMSFGKNRRGSIQVKLIATVAIVLVVFGTVLTVVGVRSIRSSTNTALESSMRETSKIAADYTGSILSQKTDLVTSVASRVGSLYSEYLEKDYGSTDIDAFETRMSEMSSTYGFDYMFVVDNEGYARTSSHTNIAAAAPEYYTAIAVKGQSFYLSDVVEDKGVVGGHVINVSAPIKDANGNVIGVLVAKLDAMFLSNIVSGINVGENGSTFVMDNNAVCIAHKNSDMLFNGAAFSGYRNNEDYKSLNKLWDSMRDNTDGVTTYDFNGNRIAAYYTVPGTNNWTVAVTADMGEFSKSTNSTVIVCITIAMVFLLIAFLACLAVIRPITRRIGKVTTRLERLSEGDLSEDVEEDKARDEVSRLSYATAMLVHDLSEMIDTVDATLSAMADGTIVPSMNGNFNGGFMRLKTAVERNLSKLGNLVEQISSTADGVSRGSAQIAEGATVLAQGASEQASSVEELYTTVTELTNQARGIANPELHYLDDGGDDATDEVEEARIEAAPTLVDKLNAAMEGIRRRLTEISKMSATINDVSLDTSMLALNASVEATHAGEFGKGFAVIAADIRSLSEKCQDESRAAETQVASILRAVDRGDQVVAYTIEAVARISTALSRSKRRFHRYHPSSRTRQRLPKNPQREARSFLRRQKYYRILHRPSRMRKPKRPTRAMTP